jgi:hypothetical protein
MDHYDFLQARADQAVEDHPITPRVGRCICDESHCVVGCEVCDTRASLGGDCPSSGAPL